MIITEEEIDEQLELCKKEENNGYSKEEIDTIFSLANGEEREDLSLEEINNLKSILRFLKINNGILNAGVRLSYAEMDKAYSYLERLTEKIGNEKVGEIVDLSNVSEFESINKSKDAESVLTEKEKNEMVASYGNDDIRLYAIRIDSINSMAIFTDDYKEKKLNERFFSAKFSHRSLSSLGYGLGKDLLEVEGNYTLIKYLGDNKFEEFYTGKIISIFKESVENPASFLTKFESYKENPLCILVGLKDLQILTSDIERSIINNAKNRDRIIEIINKADELAKKNLDKDLEQLVEEDKIFALEENRVYEFKKVM